MDSMRTQISKFLYYLSESLDISDSQYEQAKNRYMSISRWLNRTDSIVATVEPDIFPQGSFSLGTIVKPFTGEDKYDIDLVCTLQVPKTNITQRRLKEAVGYEIKGYATANNMKNPPEEGRRCWTLNYSDGAQFSMDTLPAVPDADSFRLFLESRGLSADFMEYAISITDMEHPYYDVISSDWLKSNPRGYAEWFKDQMRVRFDERRRFLAESMMKANIDEVPEYKVKTPLQRAVQILKRHRDIQFADDLENKPISIIITTLAGHAYNNEADLLDALINIVNDMPKYIVVEEGVAKVKNPVNPAENFADKWADYPEREQNFRDWLVQVRFDLRKALQSGSINEAGEFLRHRLGERSVNEVLRRFPQQSPLTLLTSDSLAKSSSHLPSPFQVPHRKPMRWKWNQKGWVSITGKFCRNGFRKHQFESEEILPKNCSLNFYAKTDISWPYKVYWQVVNTGYEARNANSLRGGFYDGIMEKGGRKRKESTLYSGMHWVECFIVKNGECVARSGEFVVNIQ